MHMRVYMHMLVCVRVQTHLRCMTSMCTHLCTNGMTRGTQRSHRCEQMPPGFLPCSFPCLLASQQHHRSLHLHLNPSLLFSSSAAATLLQHHLRPWGCKQTLPLRRATLGTVLCSGAITKSCLHRKQQLLINFQR